MKNQYGRKTISLWVLVYALGILSCDNAADTDNDQAEVATLSPADGASGISIATRVQVEVPFDRKEECRMTADNTVVKVFNGDSEVVGSRVYFIGGLRIDSRID